MTIEQIMLAVQTDRLFTKNDQLADVSQFLYNLQLLVGLSFLRNDF